MARKPIINIQRPASVCVFVALVSGVVINDVFASTEADEWSSLAPLVDAVWSAPVDGRPDMIPLATLRSFDSLAEARDTLQHVLPLLDPRTRMWAVVELARVQNRLGEPDQAIEAWQQAAELAESEGSVTEASRRWRAAAYRLFEARRFADAREMLDRAEALDRGVGHALGLARAAFVRGTIARELGYYQQASALLEKAVAQAQALGDESGLAAASDSLAVLLVELGQPRRALEVLKTLQWSDRLARERPEQYARSLNNRGWVLLRGMQQGAFGRDLDEARGLFEAARSATELASFEALVAVNLAMVAQEQEDSARARQLADEALALDETSTAYVRPFITMLDGELRMRDRDFAAALKIFETVERTARSEAGGADTDIVWTAQHAQARAQVKLKRPKDAQARFASALASLSRVGDRTGPWSGRATFFSDRRRLFHDAIDFAVARREYRRAFDIASTAQSRALRGLDARLRIERLSPAQREEWERRSARYLRLRGEYESRTREGLPKAGRARARWESARAAEQVELNRLRDSMSTYLAEISSEGSSDQVQPLEAKLGARSALVLYVRVGGVLRSMWLDPSGQVAIESHPNSDPLESAWTRLEHLDHLYVVPGDEPEALDLPARIMDGVEPAVARIGISYLPYPDLLRRRPLNPNERATRPLNAIVVADPRRDLPQARDEGRATAARFAPADLLLHEQARHSPILDRLRSGARLFHFAGHGVLRGPTPWDAYLSLAAHERLTIADVLVARPRLDVVVLNGCSTGRRLPLAVSESTGLPEAFLVAGARSVVATTRPVGDGDARRFLDHFYAADGDEHPGSAIRSAMVALYEQGDPIWDAFRLWGRP